MELPIPKDEVMRVDLLALPGSLENPPIPNHGAADAVSREAGSVNQPSVGRVIEETEGGGNSWGSKQEGAGAE